jgi:DNA-binding YbaB/EbfC family protein
MSKPPFDMNEMMRQAQAMGEQLRSVHAELRHREVSASAGGGMVTATVNGSLELVRLKIDPQAIDPSDIGMLEDLITAAVSEALRRGQQMVREELQQRTGLPLGSLLDFGGSE